MEARGVLSNPMIVLPSGVVAMIVLFVTYLLKRVEDLLQYLQMRLGDGC
ncbi:hypothetical protein PC119_g9198 [Phytophthora cactorum]|uniref:Uncharacterized protein n=1 Tax=Phytophthora cactorum TaxID=29920 RepID=A0A8T1DU16_9STRA|nr:hypothetical protein PC117_g9029 [Phytophthora cactorum]KAG3022617.1 hypothetical protein PC119_g9198 [Phytophthora cactorum]KAG3175858.1 hypothetical protein C6341_g9259 [Phytophthora cactorum]KAG4056227.1 hypothetical protein PC123_g8705 [Phytophthora cactorum]